MALEHIILEYKPPMAVITVNRPKSLNALNTLIIHELYAAFEQVDENPEIRVLVLTGAGEKAFVAGADINELNRLGPLQARMFVENGHRTMDKLQELPIPVIAAVNGFALGGGLELALSCDFIYAAENARFGLPEITLGIIPGFGGTQRLARIIGKNRAKELIFTGRHISAQEAYHLGIVNKVTAPDQLMAETMDTARVIAAKGRVSLNAAKRVIDGGLNVDLKTGGRMEIDAFALCMASEDAKKGTGAFLEKRTPEFTGKLHG